jgi:hypothetical protein
MVVITTEQGKGEMCIGNVEEVVFIELLYLVSFVKSLCPLCFNYLYLNTKDTKECTNITKLFFYSPLGWGLVDFDF